MRNLLNGTVLLGVLCGALLMASCEADCPVCGGSGVCVPCDGTGDLRKTLNQDFTGQDFGSTPAEPCTTCGGTGVCQTCNGTGKYSNI
jgi:hypothetical protein